MGVVWGWGCTSSHREDEGYTEMEVVVEGARHRCHLAETRRVVFKCVFCIFSEPKADVITANGGLRYSLHYGKHCPPPRAHHSPHLSRLKNA